MSNSLQHSFALNTLAYITLTLHRLPLPPLWKKSLNLVTNATKQAKL